RPVPLNGDALCTSRGSFTVLNSRPHVGVHHRHHAALGVNTSSTARTHGSQSKHSAYHVAIAVASTRSSCGASRRVPGFAPPAGAFTRTPSSSRANFAFP